MTTYADKTPENKSNAVKADAQGQNNDKASLQFADFRPASIAQTKLHDAMNNSPKVKQLKAYQAMADNYTMGVVQRKGNTAAVQQNEPLPASTATIQRMHWRKDGEDLIPLDPGYKKAPDTSVSFPDYAAMEEGDVWDDTNGNIYDANTGKLKQNIHRKHKDQHVLPEAFHDDLADIENTGHAKFESKGNIKSYNLKIQKLKTAIDEWIYGTDPASPPRPWADSVEKHEGGYIAAANHALKKLDILSKISMIPDSSPKAPVGMGGKAALAHGLASEVLFDNIRHITEKWLVKCSKSYSV